MGYAVIRKEPDGTRLLIGWADDIAEAGIMMDEDRRNEDYEIRYDVIKDQDKE